MLLISFKTFDFRCMKSEKKTEKFARFVNSFDKNLMILCVDSYFRRMMNLQR